MNMPMDTCPQCREKIKGCNFILVLEDHRKLSMAEFLTEPTNWTTGATYSDDPKAHDAPDPQWVGCMRCLEKEIGDDTVKLILFKGWLEQLARRFGDRLEPGCNVTISV